MVRKIFNSILTVAIVVLLSSLLIITGVLYRYFGTMQEALLRDELSFAATATGSLGKSYLEQLNTNRYRLTWITPDGTVLFDTHADISTMENHSDREEIKEALISGSGSSIRRSSTLTEQTVYEAIRLEDGSVLRISVSRLSALVLLFGMLPPTVVVLTLSIALSAWLAHRMARRVVEPLNNLDLEHPMENRVYEELSPLLHRVYAQHLEIRQQMKTLQYKQQEFEKITSNMKEALVLLDNTGKILSINPAAQALFCVENSSIGQDFLTIDRKHNIRLALEETKAKGQASFCAKKNGREYQFDLSRIESSEKKHGMVILAFDITDRVNAEKHRREFTANVSHELKTPLQSIIGSAELMKNGIVKSEDLPRFVEHIHKEASRLIFLIEDIIRLSQLDENCEMSHECISLKALSEEVLDSLCDGANLKDISLELRGDEGKMFGVRRLLYEIIYNLCDNSIKYTPTGGRVKISIREKNEQVYLTVSDTGIGIAYEHQDKIFERFYRVDKSHSKSSGGTGLGLSIVKHGVQYHQGDITLKSALNLGTSITVRFPACSKPDNQTG